MTPLFDLGKIPTRHSYSSLSVYKSCPARYGYTYLAGMKEPSTAAMDRGTRLHSLAEQYMLAPKDSPVPYDLKKIGIILYQLREKGALPEQTWCVNASWESVDEKDPSAKIKAIVDVHYLDGGVIKIRDYKSGREYPTHADQFELYAIMGLCRYPLAQRAESGGVYIDAGNEGRERSIIREMLPALTRRWTTLIVQLEGDRAFQPTPGLHCQRCSQRGSAGGPCGYEYRGE